MQTSVSCRSDILKHTQGFMVPGNVNHSGEKGRRKINFRSSHITPEDAGHLENILNYWNLYMLQLFSSKHIQSITKT